MCFRCDAKILILLTNNYVLLGLLKMEVYPEVIRYKGVVNLSCIIKGRVDESKWFIRASREKEDAPIAERLYVLDEGDQRSVSKLSINATAIWKGKVNYKGIQT